MLRMKEFLISFENMQGALPKLPPACFHCKDLLWASLVAQTVKNLPVMEETYYSRRWEAVSSYSEVKTAVSAGAWLITLLSHALSRWVPLPQQAIIFSRNNGIAN